ncbi:Cation channel sperm-associated protein 4 [Cladochytrium tenue]|nr:Cation channel sperm-associated protein 4 [Cladochytrium tenue]
MINIILLLLIAMFIWAVSGVTLFAEALPYYFGDLGTTMFTLFIMTTQIGWIDSFEELRQHGQFSAAAVYYASFMVVGVFILSKIIVAVVVSNLEEAYSIEKKNAKRRFRALRATATGTQRSVLRPARVFPHGDDAVWKTQIPYEIPDFDRIPASRVEDYVLLLAIVEENLREYAMLKERLREILAELRAVNATMLLMGDDGDEGGSGVAGDGDVDGVDGAGGDSAARVVGNVGVGGADGAGPREADGEGGAGGGATAAAVAAMSRGEVEEEDAATGGGDALSRWMRRRDGGGGGV